MPDRDRWLVVGRRRVRYSEAGAGRPFIAVHGLGLSGEFWADHLAAFARAGLRAIAPDLPGFGGSERQKRGMTVEETADWLLDFADALELARPAWLGHSIAAQATIDLAARAPHRAGALVLASPIGAPGRFRALRQLVGFVRDIGREPYALVPAVAREYLKTSLSGYVLTWLRATRDRPAQKISRILCPTLIVVGRSDAVTPMSFHETLRRRIPDARLVVLPGGAHGVVFDRDNEFDHVTTTFLREVLG